LAQSAGREPVQNLRPGSTPGSGIVLYRRQYDMGGSVELYQDGKPVEVFHNIVEVTILDKFIKIIYFDGKEKKTVRTNLQFVYRNEDK